MVQLRVMLTLATKKGDRYFYAMGDISMPWEVLNIEIVHTVKFRK